MGLPQGPSPSVLPQDAAKTQQTCLTAARELGKQQGPLHPQQLETKLCLFLLSPAPGWGRAMQPLTLSKPLPQGALSRQGIESPSPRWPLKAQWAPARSLNHTPREARHQAVSSYIGH